MPIRIAIVLRYKDEFLDSGITTVEEHNKILRKKGKVWLGKFGMPINRLSLKVSSEAHVEPFLILVRSKKGRNDTENNLFIARISKVQNKSPQPAFVPPYYRERCDVNTWICLKSEIRKMNKSEALTWVTAYSGDSLLHAIRKCPKTFLLATKESDAEKLQIILMKLRRSDEQPLRRKIKPREVNEGFGGDYDSSDEEYDLQFVAVH